MPTGVIFCFPALIDVLVGSFFFISMVRMAESGGSAQAVGLISVVWGIAYMVSCPLVGRMVTPRNAVRLMICSALAMCGCSALFIIFPGIGSLYAIMTTFGIIISFFFPPFMVFMKERSKANPNGLAYSAAIYTFAWSLGLGAGPFLSGQIWNRFGWRAVLYMDMALALLVVAGIFSIATTKSEFKPQKPLKKPVVLPDYSRYRDLVIIAWIGVGTLLFGMALVRAVFPSTAIEYGISKAHQGNAFGLICLAQSLTAFFMRKGTLWFYKPVPVCCAALSGLVGMVILGLATTWPLMYFASVLLGISCGAGFIYLAFHALVHPTRAGRYVGINEALVGLTGIIGPAAGGYLADHINMSMPYYFSAMVLAIAIAVQAIVHSRTNRMISP